MPVDDERPLTLWTTPALVLLRVRRTFDAETLPVITPLGLPEDAPPVLQAPFEDIERVEDWWTFLVTDVESLDLQCENQIFM